MADRTVLHTVFTRAIERAQLVLDEHNDLNPLTRGPESWLVVGLRNDILDGLLNDQLPAMESAMVDFILAMVYALAHSNGVRDCRDASGTVRDRRDPSVVVTHDEDWVS